MSHWLTQDRLAWLVLALPMIGACINGMLALITARFRVSVDDAWISFFGVFLPFLSFVAATTLFFSFNDPFATAPLFQWAVFHDWTIGVALWVDTLSLTMILMVTGVGTMIHLYSIGYMRGDPGYKRYFCFLNLFLTFMLLLVLANNLVVFFVGWEGVGLCSYLLIGFWFEDPAKAAAGKKAFIFNRIGDAGFLIGIFLIWHMLMSNSAIGLDVFSYASLQNNVELLRPMATIICISLFIGATGKSAQIPLYVWLPDAMAGPTPVSALIHAATMVTAGVYMIARLNFIYVLSPTALHVVATVGAVTAFFAATMGLTQKDIKKVLAYSTISQLGYMFFAVGIGAFSVGIFHLITHAYFKATLFLCAGSVIHAASGEQDIFKLGGLRKYLPTTFWTFFIATLAIVGVYPFSGFFSKDSILWEAYSSGHYFLWALGFITAGITAFYMFRLLGVTFFGTCKLPKEKRGHLRETSISMLVPLVFLAFLSFAGGFIGVPEGLGGQDYLGKWLAPVFQSVAENGVHPERLTELGMAALSVLWVVYCGGMAWIIYVQKPDWPDAMAAKFRHIYQLLCRCYYVDEIYRVLIVRPLALVSEWALWRWLDDLLIDRVIVPGPGRILTLGGRLIGVVQTGLVTHYLFYIVIGAVALITWLVL